MQLVLNAQENEMVIATGDGLHFAKIDPKIKKLVLQQGKNDLLLKGKYIN